jgi:hypothetical protein
VLKVIGGVHRNDLSVIHDGNAITQLIGLVHIVRRQDHRNLFFLVEPPDVLPDVPPGLRIKPERGFVEKQDLRVVKQTTCDL